MAYFSDKQKAISDKLVLQFIYHIMISKKQESTNNLEGYKRLIAWQKANELAKRIYLITQTFPKSELYGLVAQLRRAALSVPANIVEGYARVNKNEFRRFLSIGLGSLAEVEYFLTFAYEQKFFKTSDFNLLMSLKKECGRLIWRLYQSQK